MSLRRNSRDELRKQRLMSRVTVPIWLGGAIAAMRLFGYRIQNVSEVRRQYQAIIDQVDGPVLLCANHLTMIDSPIVAWALRSGPWYLRHVDQVPWNVPERSNFGAPWQVHLAAYLMRCILVERGGSREGVEDVLERIAFCLRRSEPVLVFPEGTRSRTGRVDMESTQYGVGRILNMVENCSVVCVYMRGRGQDSWGSIPSRGERFDVSLALLQPTSEYEGLRGSRDLSRQVVAKLIEMETACLENRDVSSGMR